MTERNTKQKAIIYDALQTLDHPTATEVFGYVHERYPTVSRATVFRVLSGFAVGGRAQEIKMAGTDVRYDFTMRKHSHVHCRVCGRVTDVYKEDFPELSDEFKENVGGFEVEGYSLEFYGIC
ncbi:MAG: transcriptional repressor, partial [Clostridia bacterium]|nr:transcriptional repressor [Clostridia bacterium]